MSDDIAGTLDRAVRAGTERALSSFRGDLAVETKRGPMDAVTAVDREAQAAVTEVVRDARPDAVVVGEEDDAPKDVPAEGEAWVVDPIDGTNNYVAGNRTWAVSVAVVVDGGTVAAANDLPALGDSYRLLDGDPTRNGERVSTSDRTEPSAFTVAPVFGLRPRHRRGLSAVCRTVVAELGDLRRVGCAQAALSMVADGQLEAAVSTVPLHPWDTVAGVALVRAAGGTVTDPDGARWTPDSGGMVASNGRAHDALCERFEPTPPG
jgi:myo-inositol-1(or 4)-monophosphatase